MDREAFKQRMQSLKSYREQNPGKGYLDWKTSLPDNLQDESSYNLQRAYELGYEPEYVEEDRSYHLPTRDQETGEILKKPWHSTFLIGLQEDAKLGYYPQTINGVTYTTTWEGNENPIYKYADGGEVPPTNKPTIIEPIPYKGKLYSDRQDMAMIMPQYPIPNYKDGGIHIKKKNRGKFNALKKRTGKTTEELTHSKNPLTRKRAIFAQNARKWKHKGRKKK